MTGRRVTGDHATGRRTTGRRATGHRVVVIGDLMNDVVAVPAGDIRSDTDTPSTIRRRPGGSAANTAVWLASAGMTVDFVGAVGAENAAQHADDLRDRGVSAHLHVNDELPTGTIVVIVDGERRTMLTEPGANALIRGTAVTTALLGGASVVHATGHGALRDPSGFDLPDLVDRALSAGAVMSVTAGSAGLLRDGDAARFAEETRGADVMFATGEEAGILTGRSAPREALTVLRERHATVVITLGTDGCLAASEGQPTAEVPALRARSVDPTGAGDAFAAGFLERWMRGADLEAAARSGTLFAARAVGILGGRPAR